jgi:putative ABC transport system permease protein
MLLVSAFGFLAVVLTCIGLYGMLSYSVAQRTREIGIRMALGAERRDVFGIIIRQGVRLAIMGIAIGLAGAWATTRLLKNQLFGVQATDPLTFLAAAFLLAMVALLACYVPARRAITVDPVVALRHE